MGADRADGRTAYLADDRGPAGRRRRRAVPGACAALGVVLLAGCASMPDSGDLRGVESTPRQDTQVRVFAVPPREEASVDEIVQGFLEALTSDDPNYDTARKYLTRQAVKTWRPEGSVTVLANDYFADSESVRDREDRSDEFGMSVVGTKVATLDGQNAYTPDQGKYRGVVHLVRNRATGGQWRIDRLPQGIVMGQSDFLRNYMSVNRYYFASNTADKNQGRPVAVADPVYIRKQVDPMTSVVRSLLAGPTWWLDPAVRSGFPTGTALARSVHTLTPDDQNKLTVPLNDRAKSVSSTKCAEMAAQLYYTLQDLTPTGVGEVELRSGGRRLCTLDEERAESVATTSSQSRPEYQYLVVQGRLVRLPVTDEGPETEPVPGALGTTAAGLRSAAVSRDERMAAGVSADGSRLYVGSLASGGSLGEPVLRSDGKSADARLTTPSWDSSGDLWIADRDPARPRLLLFEQGAGQPLTVNTSGLDGRIDAVRVAADGVRVALIVKQADGRRTLQVGRIERSDVGSASADGTSASDGGSATGSPAEGEARVVVSVGGLRPTAPQFEEVSAMSWAGDSRLVVVGREQGGVQQMSYVQADGSTPAGPAPAALTGVKEIAAAEDDELPLLAYSSEDGIVRLPSGAQWQKVVKDGAAPVYPG